MTAAHRGDARSVSPVAWAWWLVTGAAIGIGTIGLLSIGAPILLLGVILAIVGARSSRLNGRANSMLISGLSVAPLALAWLNRRGPGTVCSAGGDDCSDKYSPWPFAVVAVVLLATGLRLALRAPKSGPSTAVR
jgi:hypothetical protein